MPPGSLLWASGNADVLSGIPFPSGQFGLTSDGCHRAVLAHFSVGVLHQRHISQLLTGRPKVLGAAPEFSQFHGNRLAETRPPQGQT